MSDPIPHGFRSAGCLLGFLATWAMAQLENWLSLAEFSAGYNLLFNGTDLSGWHAYRSIAAPGNSFAVKTDAPLGSRIEIVPGQYYILTDKQYKNFDLKVDVKVPARGVSGIFTRYEEIAVSPVSSASDPWFLLCGRMPVGECGSGYTFGSSYDLFPVRDSLRSTWFDSSGAWNRIRIVAYDSNYVHHGNGRKLLEYKIGSPEFLDAYERSRFVSDGNTGRFYDIHFGGFMLQHHGELGFSFKNFMARELDAHPFRREFPDGKWPDSLPQEFVIGGPNASTSGFRKQVSPGFTALRGGSGETWVEIPPGASGLRITRLDGSALNPADHGCAILLAA